MIKAPGVSKSRKKGSEKNYRLLHSVNTIDNGEILFGLLIVISVDGKAMPKRPYVERHNANNPR